MIQYKLLLLLFAALALTASARDIPQSEARQLTEDGVIISLEKLLKPIYKKYPKARLLDAELEYEQNQYRYEIDIVTEQGIVRELDFNAATGELLRDREDD